MLARVGSFCFVLDRGNNKRGTLMNRSRALGAVLVCLALSAGSSKAGVVTQATLTDANSTVSVDLNGPNAGMNAWTVNGISQLAKQWFWYRIGSTGPEASVDSLGNLVYVVSDTNGDGNNDTLHVSYTGVDGCARGTQGLGGCRWSDYRIRQHLGRPMESRIPERLQQLHME